MLLEVKPDVQVPPEAKREAWQDSPSECPERFNAADTLNLDSWFQTCERMNFFLLL
jgi:hypothetical protein